MLLVHGVGLRKEVWAPQVDAFAAGRRVIVYDTLGHGESDRPPASARLVDYVTQLEGLVDALDIERAVVVGHSMGAAIATAFAIENPARVTALAALCPVYGRSAEARSAARARARTLERDGPLATLDETLGGWLASADAAGYARAYRVFVGSDEALAGRLGALRAPALFLAAEHDANSTPQMSERMAREAPRGVAAVVPHARHMVPFVSPEPVNARLGAFLEEHDT
jgi:pimeloyl-ACP methyl ester carboxylesterase